MALPIPVQGLVIRYSYLCRSEHLRGRDEGVKDRPCAVILVTRLENEDRVVTVLPITHTPPLELSFAVEIPYSTKQRLGLDAERSWVMLSEANRFVWPGPDLRPLRGADVASIAYGMLPYRLMEDIRMKFIAHIKARRAKLVSRTE